MATSFTVGNFPSRMATAERTAAPTDMGDTLWRSKPASVVVRDGRRTWLWWFLAIVAASQLYFFRELLAAFVIFALAFAAVTLVVVSLYMLVKCGELALARFSALRHPVDNLASAANISPVTGMASVTQGNRNAA